MSKCDTESAIFFFKNHISTQLLPFTWYSFTDTPDLVKLLELMEEDQPADAAAAATGLGGGSGAMTEFDLIKFQYDLLEAINTISGALSVQVSESVDTGQKCRKDTGTVTPEQYQVHLIAKCTKLLYVALFLYIPLLSKMENVHLFSISLPRLDKCHINIFVTLQHRFPSCSCFLCFRVFFFFSLHNKEKKKLFPSQT